MLVPVPGAGAAGAVAAVAVVKTCWLVVLIWFVVKFSIHRLYPKQEIRKKMKDFGIQGIS